MQKKIYQIAVFLVLLLLQLNSFGQLSRFEAYSNAIDDINCATVKLLLVGYDRPVAANNIQTCSYNEVVSEVSKVQENEVKGYVNLFLDFSSTVNTYKSNIAEDASYDEFATALEGASNYASQQFQQICERYQTPTNSICVKLPEKVVTLESDLNTIVNRALAQMGGNIDNAEYEEDPSTETENGGKRIAPIIPSTEEYTKDAPVTITKPLKKSTTGTSWIVILLLILLIAAIAWLFKENHELKEEMEDLKMLLKILTQKK